jgi:hypothetical protein
MNELVLVRVLVVGTGVVMNELVLVGVVVGLDVLVPVNGVVGVGVGLDVLADIYL